MLFTHAVMGAFVNKSQEWREFNKELIDVLIDHEDERRLKEARKMYDAINVQQKL